MTLSYRSFKDLNRTHTPFLQRVDAGFQAKGYITGASPFYDKHDKRLIELLENTFGDNNEIKDILDKIRTDNKITEVLQNSKNSISALHIRTSADRIAVHPITGRTILYEAKTADIKRDVPNLATEVIQLGNHIWNSYIGEECLYCYYDPFWNFEVGFWTTPDIVSKISCIMFKPNLSKEMVDELTPIFKMIFGESMPMVFLDKVTYPGSPDPFLLVKASELRKMPHWNELIP